MNKLFNLQKKIVESVIPDLTNNNFQKTGLLTKHEFKKAGDYLVNKYPEWEWLQNEQVLIFKNIIFSSTTETFFENKQSSSNKEDDNEWNIYENKTNKLQTKVSCQSELTDLELELEEELSQDSNEMTVDPSRNDLQKKIYDITITYDQYYRTPRIWFHCYNFHGQPISNELILQDFSIEHTGVSIKIETHPFYKLESVSIHPCRHSEVMKKLISIELENKKKVFVEQYFVFFLKFVSCCFQHMNFDFTTL